MIFYSFRLLSLMFFISNVISVEFNDSTLLQSSHPNNYKIQIAGIEQNASYVRDISNEDPDALRRHIYNIKAMKLSLYERVKGQDSAPRFFDSSLREFKSDALHIEYQVFSGVNHEYVSSNPIILYKCFLCFAQKIRIVAPKINIGECFFVPSALSVSIIFECPEEIDGPLRSIEIIARDSPLSEEELSVLPNRHPKLKNICNGTALQDNCLHFEGWVDFTSYRSKKNTIKFSIDKNWLVIFNFRS